MPEMAAVFAGDKCVGAISWRDMYTRSGSTPSHNGAARPMPSREASTGNVSAATTEVSTAAAAKMATAATTKVSTATTTKVSAAATTKVSAAATTTTAAVFRGSIGGKR